MRPRGAQQHRHERQRNGAGTHTGDQQDAADELDRERRVAESAGQAERLEELCGAGQREDEVLEQRVGDEHRAQRKAQHQGCGGGVTGCRGFGHVRS
jgi:hypothetical protein